MTDDLTVQQTELLACEQILTLAKSFYEAPENRQAFIAWQQNKEEQSNGSSNHSTHI